MEKQVGKKFAQTVDHKARKGTKTWTKIAEKREWQSEVLDIYRVSKTTAGGRNLRFGALVCTGNGTGIFGIGNAKGQDVADAIKKAENRSKKNMISIPIDTKDITIPHDIETKYNCTKIVMRSAKLGTGVKSNRIISKVLIVAGIKNIVCKCIGSTRAPKSVVNVLLKAIKQLASVKLISERLNVSEITLKQRRNIFLKGMSRRKNEISK